MEKERLTIDQKLQSRKIEPVGKLPYRFMVLVSKVLFFKKYDVKMNVKVDLTPYRNTSYVVISNHASRADYVYIGIPFFPDTLNYVMGYNEIFRSHLNKLLKAMKIIQKKNFVPDLYSMRQILRVIKHGGRIAILPEGMSSISGHNQPIQTGTADLLKKLGVPVFYCKISGGYLINPKFDMTERPGHSEVEVDLMFSPEELKNSTTEEINNKMEMLLWHDDYDWNKEHHYAYKSKDGMAKNLHQLLFWCPKCHKPFGMQSNKDTLSCKHCGCGVKLDEYYDMSPLTEDSVVPKTPSYWFDMERAWVKKQVSKDGFNYHEHVKIGTLPKYELLKKEDTSEIVGDGILSLNKDGLHFSGNRDGKPFVFDLPSKQVPTYGMCTDVSRFYTFVGSEFIEFYPDGDTAEYWMMATEEIHRLNNGPWKDFPEGHPARERLSREFLDSLE